MSVLFTKVANFILIATNLTHFHNNVILFHQLLSYLTLSTYTCLDNVYKNKILKNTTFVIIQMPSK